VNIQTPLFPWDYIGVDAQRVHWQARERVYHERENDGRTHRGIHSNGVQRWLKSKFRPPITFSPGWKHIHDQRN
jgi:hypothetical protein